MADRDRENGMNGKRLAAAAAVAMGASLPASACTPVPVVGMLLSGSAPFAGFITGTLVGLLVVVAIKSMLFAHFASYGMRRGMVDMLVANIASTVPGLILGGLIASSSGIFIGLALSGCVLSIVAARVFAKGAATHYPSATARTLAVLTCAAMLGCFMLTSISLEFQPGEIVQDRATALAYWAFKTCGVFLGLGAAIAVSVVFEGAVIFRAHRKDEDFPHCRALDAVIKANLGVFLLASVAGALMSLPERLSTPGFLNIQ